MNIYGRISKVLLQVFLCGQSINLFQQLYWSSSQLNSVLHVLVNAKNKCQMHLIILAHMNVLQWMLSPKYGFSMNLCLSESDTDW